MSCDWDVRCLDCKSDLGISNANHAVGLMRAIVAHAKVIGALVPFMKEADLAGYFVDLTFGDGTRINAEWLAQHADHHLVPVDEYGVLDGACGVRVVCPECNRDDVCRLPKGHSGDHSCKKEKL